MFIRLPPQSTVPPGSPDATADEDPNYTKLVNLKKLLDSGVITKAEFDAEKAKILSRP